MYPVVYAAMIIPLFVQHCRLFTKHSAPIALTTTADIFVAGQCAAICIVFMVLERPWRLVTKQEKLESRKDQSDGMELAPVRTRTMLNSQKAPDEVREWWEQEAYNCNSRRSEESDAANESERH